jgi:polysaccharide deacetylase 2 family uncharacterized protein YibQ
VVQKSRSVSSSRYRPRRGTKQSAQGRRSGKVLLFFAAVLGCGLLYYEKLPQQDPKETLIVVPSDYSILADTLDEAAVRALKGQGIIPDWISRSHPKGRDNSEKSPFTRTHVRVPGNLPLALCNLEVTQAVRRLGGSVIDGTEDGLGTRVTLSIGVHNTVTGRIILTKDPSLERPEGKAALIIDDFGEVKDETSEGFLNLAQPLTLAVLPGLRASQEVAEQAHERGFEVMLHLPMEPHNSHIDPGKDAIYAHMSPSEIQERVQKNLESVPHIRGVNNHMGSKVTENETAMEAVLKEIKREKLYWVDSRTSSKSIAYDVAKKLGLQAASSGLFIDSEPEIEKIRAKLERVFELATVEGDVIAIGHCRPLTLQVLRQELPKLEKRGITFVYVSELVE